MCPKPYSAWKIVCQRCSDGILLPVDFQNRHLCMCSWFDITYDSFQPLFKKIGLQCFSDAISRHSFHHIFQYCYTSLYLYRIYLWIACLPHNTLICEAKSTFCKLLCIIVSAKCLKCWCTSFLKYILYFSCSRLRILHKEKHSCQNLMYSQDTLCNLMRFSNAAWKIHFSLENCIMKDSQDICCHTYIDVVFV